MNVNWGRLNEQIGQMRTAEEGNAKKDKYRATLNAIDTLIKSIDPNDIPSIYEINGGYDKGALNTLILGVVQRACNFFDEVKPRLSENPKTLTDGARKELEKLKPRVTEEAERLAEYEKANSDLRDAEKALKALEKECARLKLLFERVRELNRRKGEVGEEIKIKNSQAESIEVAILVIEGKIDEVDSRIADAKERHKESLEKYRCAELDLQELYHKHQEENKKIRREFNEQVDALENDNDEADKLISRLSNLLRGERRGA